MAIARARSPTRSAARTGRRAAAADLAEAHAAEGDAFECPAVNTRDGARRSARDGVGIRRLVLHEGSARRRGGHGELAGRGPLSTQRLESPRRAARRDARGGCAVRSDSGHQLCRMVGVAGGVDLSRRAGAATGVAACDPRQDGGDFGRLHTAVDRRSGHHRPRISRVQNFPELYGAEAGARGRSPVTRKRDRRPNPSPTRKPGRFVRC